MTAKAFLNDTDWIVVKIAEQGDDVRSKYQRTLYDRTQARAIINELEAQAALDDQADFEQAMAEHDPDWQAKRDLINHNK